MPRRKSDIMAENQLDDKVATKEVTTDLVEESTQATTEVAESGPFNSSSDVDDSVANNTNNEVKVDDTESPEVITEEISEIKNNQPELNSIESTEEPQLPKVRVTPINQDRSALGLEVRYNINKLEVFGSFNEVYNKYKGCVMIEVPGTKINPRTKIIIKNNHRIYCTTKSELNKYNNYGK